MSEKIVTFQEVAEIKERIEKHSGGLATASEHDASLRAERQLSAMRWAL